MQWRQQHLEVLASLHVVAPLRVQAAGCAMIPQVRCRTICREMETAMVLRLKVKKKELMSESDAAAQPHHSLPVEPGVPGSNGLVEPSNGSGLDHVRLLV